MNNRKWSRKVGRIDGQTEVIRNFSVWKGKCWIIFVYFPLGKSKDVVSRTCMAVRWPEEQIVAEIASVHQSFPYFSFWTLKHIFLPLWWSILVILVNGIWTEVIRPTFSIKRPMSILPCSFLIPVGCYCDHNNQRSQSWMIVWIRSPQNSNL